MEIAKTIIFLICIQIAAFFASCCIGHDEMTGWMKWVDGSIDNGGVKQTISIGLWRECTQYNRKIDIGERRCIVCQELKITKSLRAVQAFIILALICSVSALILSGLIFSFKIKAKLISIALFGAALCGTIAMSIFSDKSNQKNIMVTKVAMDYDWAFIIGWFTSMECINASILILIWSMRTGS